jgi:hypothetical protein
MKLPRLPRKCSVFDAKYSAQQMHEYAQKAIEQHMKTLPTLEQVVETQKSIIDKIKESWT